VGDLNPKVFRVRYYGRLLSTASKTWDLGTSGSGQSALEWASATLSSFASRSPRCSPGGLLSLTVFYGIMTRRQGSNVSMSIIQGKQHRVRLSARTPMIASKLIQSTVAATCHSTAVDICRNLSRQKRDSNVDHPKPTCA
jgi:hypothetical protein